MNGPLSRTRLLLGQEGLARLRRARVAVFGLGGVGSYAVEALVRSGVGRLTLVDDDRICLTNLNRQLLATRGSVGAYKTQAALERVHAISPETEVDIRQVFFTPEEAADFDFGGYDYIIDAIDTVTGKLAIVCGGGAAGTPVISAMGTGNKLDAAALRVGDIYDTSVCPLARVMRRELRRRGVEALKVVYSTEPPMKPREEPACRGGCVCPPGTARTCAARRQIPGSTAFVPAAAGLILAGEVVQALSGVRNGGGGK